VSRLALDRAVVAYTTAGNYGIGWVVVGAICGAPVRVAATVWGTLGLNYAVKLAVGRERPAPADAMISLPSSSSFPSSHAAMSIAAAFALSRAQPDLAPVWWTAAVAMAASRVYVGAHRPCDVVAGAALGAVTGAAAGAV
jgi:decaprenylphosphoryl-5-phosphoribose phosphatase